MTRMPPWTELNTLPTAPLADHGGEYLDTLAQQLMIDREWTVRSERRIDWWGGPIPMRITATEPRSCMGDPTIKVTAAVRMVTEIGEPLGSGLPVITGANALTVGFGLWANPGDGDVWASTSFYLHPGNRSFLDAGTIAAHILMTYGAAIAKAPHLAEVLGGKVANDPHPASGVREDWDELTDISSTLVEPAGRMASRWDGSEFVTVERFFTNQSLMSTRGSDGVTTEFPFTSFRSALEEIATGIVDDGSTSLYEMSAQAHPALGNGLFCLLRLPMSMPTDEAALLCNGLNWAEANELTGFASWGAWTTTPSTTMPDHFDIAHVLFHPNMLFRPGAAQTIGFYAFLRGAWAQDRLVDPNWLRVVRGGEA